MKDIDILRAAQMEQAKRVQIEAEQKADAAKRKGKRFK